MDEQKELLIVDLLTALLSEEGFKWNKTSKIWWKKENSIWNLIHFQTSAWGEMFYLNFGIYFEAFEPTKKKPPKFNNWHFEARYESLLNLSSDEHLALFSTDKEETIKDNLQVMSNKIINVILPLMKQLNNYSYLSKKITEKTDINGFIAIRFPQKKYQEFFEKMKPQKF